MTTDKGSGYQLQRPEGARVAVVILNWNGRKLMEEFLPKVTSTTGLPGRVIVVDNGSDDDSVAWLRSCGLDIDTIEFDRNYGFAEGYNRAIRIVADAGYEYAVLLNSDAATGEGWLQPLVDYMDSHPDTGACQPKLLSYREPEMFEYAGASGGFIDRNGYPYCRGRIFDTCERDNGQYDDTIEIDWASGAAMMTRTDAYLKAGGLDAEFFAHMEEIDLCWRMRLEGWKIAVVPQSRVYHLGGGSLPPGAPKKVYLNFRNNLLMLSKNLPAEMRERKLFWRRVLDAAAWGKFVVTGKLKSAQALVRAHIDFRSMSAEMPQRSDSDRPADATIASRPDILVEYYLKRRKHYSDLPTS